MCCAATWWKTAAGSTAARWTGPADRAETSCAAAHPWLGAVHPGRDAGLVVTTLGTGDDEQIIDALHGNFRSNFLLHYNFPPYSVGEAGRVGPPGRREIGHGKLAWRRCRRFCRRRPTSPTRSACLRDHRIERLLLDGVGLRRVAVDDGCGRAAEGAGGRRGHGPDPGRRRPLTVLTDILGDEDHLGDMDFKVAGTERGITSLQMDIKVAGITPEIMEKALAQAKDGRMHILGEMAKALTRRRVLGPRAADRDDADPHRQDPRSDRLGRQGDPRDRRGPAPRSISTTTASSRSPRPTATPSRRPMT
jgi:hypothetical protein